MADQKPTSDLDRALYMADKADAITKQYYLSVDLQVTDKPDSTPVTQADLEVEQTLSRIVRDEFQDGFIGEEGARDKSKDRYWVIDPVDGTKNFTRGMPVWATLIALHDKEGLKAAAVSAPALGRRWWAARGEGAWTRDVDGTTRRLKVSRVSHISDAYVSIGSLYAWEEVPTGVEPVLKLLKEAWRHRAFGDFLAHVMIAEGALDASFEPNIKQWDIDAPALIITEAGGSVWSNATEDTPPEQPRMVITSNGLLEQALREVLDKSG